MDLYYLLFPYADGDLVGLWERQATPSPRKNLEWFLRQCQGLADGLCTIHESIGCHGDIKPENVLWFKDNVESSGVDEQVYGTLRVSDFGQAGLQKKNTQHTLRRGGTTTTWAVTPAYRPPESDTTGQPRSRRFDIWSLACTYVEFASWLLLGNEGINEFRRSREAADRDRVVAGAFFTSPVDVFGLTPLDSTEGFRVNPSVLDVSFSIISSVLLQNSKPTGKR